ncbi:copper chaperone PCu(A)C [Intrasporangium sp. DVR]|uniref:copper chaperone PCu(A)C n=1 Tax=Intrasporangium sp. DVR TaxID=3127867 RepID=UPI00313A53CF
MNRPLPLPLPRPLTRPLTRPLRRRGRSAAMATAVLAAALTVASCGTAADPASPSAVPGAATATSSTTESEASRDGTVALESGWAKAGAGMTAVFGTVVNRTDADVTIVGGSSPSAGEVQVHTMAKQPDGSMRMVQKKGGLTVPAGGSAELAPGGDHIMLLALAAPLVNGDDVALRMITKEGTQLEWTVPVRSFAGAEETYVPEDH